MKTFAVFLLSKESFTIRTCSILASFFRKLLSKATLGRKFSSVSLPLLSLPSSRLRGTEVERRSLPMTDERSLSCAQPVADR